MKTILSKILAAGGVFAVCAAAGPGAFAQGYDGPYHNQQRRFHMQSIRRQITMLQAAYAHDVSIGDYRAAARDHRKAEALRMRLRNRASEDYDGYRTRDGYGMGGRY